MGWNGADLVSDFSALLGDTTSSFKSRVETWLNDIERDICFAHDWSFLRLKGKKLMVTGEEEQSLIISAPAAASLAIDAGGSLTANSSYALKVAFYDPNNKVEKIGTASSSVTVSGSNLKINVTSIPLSTESLFTQRKLYLSKDSGEYYYLATIADNTTSTYTITTDTSSLIKAPDFDYFRQLDGNPFYESSQGELQFITVAQLRKYLGGAITSGTPETWSDLSQGQVLLYPKPNATTALSFYYYKMPRGIYNDSASIPTLPIILKEVLEAGVEYKGFKYRDRAGTVEKYNIYQAKLKEAIDRFGSANTKTIKRVRDTQGRSSGRGYY